MYKTVYNPSDTALTVDEEGRVIGGRDWGTVNTTDQRSSDLIDADDLLVMEPNDDTSNRNPAAMAAFQRTKDIEERAARVAALDKDTLQQTAQDAGLVEEGEKVGVRVLREQVAENTDVKVPSKSTTKKEA